MAQLRVPGTHPDLASAVDAAQAGDTIVLEGEVDAHELRIRKPLSISGGRIKGQGQFALGLFDDIELTGVELHHLGGHGVVIMGGSPTLRELTLRVKGTAIACGQQSTPSIHKVVVQGCSIGMTVQDQAQPRMEECQITSSGSGLFFTGSAGGLVASTAISAGKMAAIEVGGQASPSLAGVAVVAGAAGGFFIHDQATPKLAGCIVQRTALAGMEVDGAANPTVDAFLVKDGMGGGLFLHGKSTGTYMEVEVHGCALSAVEISEHATPDLERMLLKGGGGGGLYIHGNAKVEVLELRVDGVAFQAVEVGDEAELSLEDSKLLGSGSFGVLAQARGKLQLTRCEVSGGQDWGIRVQDAAVVGMIGGAVRDNHMGAVRGSGGGQVVLADGAELSGVKTMTERAGVVEA